MIGGLFRGSQSMQWHLPGPRTIPLTARQPVHLHVSKAPKKSRRVGICMAADKRMGCISSLGFALAGENMGRYSCEI